MVLYISKADPELVGVPEAEGYTLVSTQELKVDPEDDGSTRRSSLAVRDAEKSSVTNGQPKAPLSVNQLILRRGLALFIVVILLAIGVAFHFAFPVPEPTIRPWTNGTMAANINFTSTPQSLWDFTVTPQSQH